MECFFLKIEDNENFAKNFSSITEKYRSLLHLEKIPGWKTKFEDFGNNFQNLHIFSDENKNLKSLYGRVLLNFEGKIFKFLVIIEQDKPYEIKCLIKGKEDKNKLIGEEKKMIGDCLKVQFLEHYMLESVCLGTGNKG